MTPLQNVRNSIESVLLQNDPEDIRSITDDMYALFLTESWTHVEGEFVTVTSLTDREFRVLAEWARLSSKHYTRPIAHIKDMREIFPGISLACANHFVRNFHA